MFCERYDDFVKTLEKRRFLVHSAANAEEAKDIGLSLIGIVIGEMIGSKRGLGYLIIYSSQVFQLTTMIMAIVILCVMAILLYALISLLQWSYEKKSENQIK